GVVAGLGEHRLVTRVQPRLREDPLLLQLVHFGREVQLGRQRVATVQPLQDLLVGRQAVLLADRFESHHGTSSLGGTRCVENASSCYASCWRSEEHTSE